MATKFLELLETLHRGGVRFVLVGGVSAVLHGAPLHTFDVDVVHARDRENIGRLLTVLEKIDAIYRAEPERRLRPSASHLGSMGHQNLITRLGPLDLLGTIGENEGYAELVPKCDLMRISEGVIIPVLQLDAYIRLKEALSGEKDRAALPILRQTLHESQKRSSR